MKFIKSFMPIKQDHAEKLISLKYLDTKSIYVIFPPRGHAKLVVFR